MLFRQRVRGLVCAHAITVTLTRIAPRKFDGDGVVASCKHVRDGVADALGIDDGDERITWLYAQRKAEPADGLPAAARGYGVRIQVEAVKKELA